MAERGSPRLLIADDHQPTLDQLADELRDDGFVVVAQCVDAVGAIEAAAETEPDICLLDVQMPGASGIEAAFTIGQQFPNANIVLITASPNELDLADAIRAGAHGYLSKDINPSQLAIALRAVASGETAFPREGPPVA